MSTDGSGGDTRQELVTYLEDQLIGPVGGRTEMISDPPHRRYLAGILFPRDVDANAGLEGDIVDETADEPGEEGTGDPIALTTEQLPSSVGLSFVLPRWEPFKVELSAARYSRLDDAWSREPLETLNEEMIDLSPPADGGWGPTKSVSGWNASLRTLWRHFGEGALVTVALVNDLHVAPNGRIDPSQCLMQVRMRCISDSPLEPYPVPMRVQVGDEEMEQALLYRDVPTYAVGHGSAAVWPISERPLWIETSYLPSHVVPGVDFRLEGQGDEEPVFDLEVLQGITSNTQQVIQLLNDFVAGYDHWAEKLSTVSVDSHYLTAARRNLKRIDTARARMRTGVKLLESSERARKAFSLTNEAMLMQMVHSRPEHAGRKRSLTGGIAPHPSYRDTGAKWRPFQLAFLLLTLESTVDEKSPDREVVDLIWFPTGGGKTEAYLGLLAFTVFHRRLLRGDEGAGTTVITRYTLRLLTSQQFQRAATLICACERLRVASEELGTRPISIGVWLGGNNSPNRYADAVNLVDKLKSGEWTEQSFQVESCPWCGTQIIPDGDQGDEAWGVDARNDSFRMNCPSPQCDFHHELPVSSVDQDLYDRPPTVLIGTVDKFARLAWDERAGVLLGAGDDPGPSLIIQDEFHLISGPLGTVVGLYEAAFDVVMERHGARPKVVASTATVRRADAQGRGVFGRHTALFPPPGLSSDDSYFVRQDKQSAGRRYVGVMPQGHTPLTAMVHLSAALLQSSEELKFHPPADDAYWTLVAYHNSLRELGKSVTLAHDDIPARMSVIASADDGVRSLGDDEIVELTSNISPSAIPGKIAELKRERSERGAKSFVASTNMLSVGVDVGRLGLMLIVGQPKTTAEYIQASSRVGRQFPGLVCTLYSPSKSRDRSHFESFTAYHSALYRHVEPTSVTPFSVPARDRALHAGLVVLARHALGLAKNTSASEFDSDAPDLHQLLEEFLERAGVADPDELQAVRRHLEELCRYWSQMVDEARPSGGLMYESSGKQSVALLKRYGEGGEGWPTLNSMRNVDTEVRMRVRGAS